MTPLRGFDGKRLPARLVEDRDDDQMPDSGDGGCGVLLDDGGQVFSRRSRLGDDSSRTSILVVLPSAEHPSRSFLGRLTNEY
jgi:hypothetical protein